MPRRAELVLVITASTACFGTAPELDTTATGSDGPSSTSGAISTPCSAVEGDVIACIDFEDDMWSDLLTIDGGAGLSIAESEPGNRALEITHDAAFVGRAFVLFGDAPMVPGSTVLRVGEAFSEIHLRFRMRTSDGWSATGGFGDLAQIVGMDDISFDNGSAFSAALFVPVDAGVAANVQVRSCVQSDGTSPCAMGADASQPIAASPLGVDTSLLTLTQWRCLTMSMVLDDDGDAGGSVRVQSPPEVDVVLDQLEVRRTAITGLNAAHFSTSWNGGTAPQSRWLDDIAISTAPLPCE